jgi:hypothetical protein
LKLLLLRIRVSLVVEAVTLISLDSGLQAELHNLVGQIENQRYRARLSGEAEARYRNLAGRGALSKDALQQKQAEAEYSQRQHPAGWKREAHSDVCGCWHSVQTSECASLFQPAAEPLSTSTS